MRIELTETSLQQNRPTRAKNPQVIQTSPILRISPIYATLRVGDSCSVISIICHLLDLFVESETFLSIFSIKTRPAIVFMRLHVRPRKLRVDDIHIVLAPQIFRPQIFGVDKHIRLFPFLIKQITNESVLLMKRAHRLFSFKTRQFFVTEYMPQKLVEINRLFLLRTNGIRKRSFPTPAKFFSFSLPFFDYDSLIFQYFSYVHFHLPTPKETYRSRGKKSDTKRLVCGAAPLCFLSLSFQ